MKFRILLLSIAIFVLFVCATASPVNFLLRKNEVNPSVYAYRILPGWSNGKLVVWISFSIYDQEKFFDKLVQPEGSWDKYGKHFFRIYLENGGSLSVYAPSDSKRLGGKMVLNFDAPNIPCLDGKVAFSISIMPLYSGNHLSSSVEFERPGKCTGDIRKRVTSKIEGKINQSLRVLILERAGFKISEITYSGSSDEGSLSIHVALHR